MAEQTSEYRRVKNASAWVGLALGVVALTAGFAKTYFVTPMKIEQHDRQIEKLEKDMASQRDLLLEIRGDVKYLKRGFE